MKKHKVTLYIILFTTLVLSLAAYRNMTLNPLNWGDGTRVYLLLVIPVGILVFVALANERVRNISHWALYGLVIFVTLFIIFEQIYPGLK